MCLRKITKLAVHRLAETKQETGRPKWKTNRRPGARVEEKWWVGRLGCRENMGPGRLGGDNPGRC